MEPPAPTVGAQRTLVRPELTPSSPLTTRQAEVLAAVANGATTVEIAAALWITPEAARTLVYSARIRLGARTRAHAVTLALAHGWLVRDEAAEATAA
jgi:DNA-binding CsgD family transcriptional regulator